MNKLTILALGLCCAIFAQNYKIAGPANPRPCEETAIKDLSTYLEKRIDGTLSIGGKSSVTFQVGDTDLAKENGMLSTQLPDEKWVIKSIGDQVLINGGGQHGTLYATYHFLEDYCDIHWWSDFEDYVPPTSSLELPALDASGKPYFIYRNIHRGPGWSSQLTSIRNRLNANGAHVRSTKAVGGSVDYGRPGWAHTHSMYITEKEYFADHPEYFAVVAGKRRGGAGSQLCLSNPDLVQIFADKMCKYIEQDRAEAAKNGVPYPIFYEVSMNDNHLHCQCEKCTEYAQKYEFSSQVIEFLNAISKIVTPKYPDIYISTLAYFFTDTPPKKDIKTEKNIVIRLCDTKTNQARSILDPENKVFRDYIEAWKQHTDNLFIWDYAIIYDKNSMGIPFASEFYYGDLYKFYRDNNVTGIFWEHEDEYKVDMFEYKYFIECKLLEDPDADIKKLQNLFLSRYYGPAATHILEYRMAVDKALKDNKGSVPFTSSLSSFSFLDNATVNEIDKIFKRAEETVQGNELLLSRVRRARLGIDRLIVQRYGLNSHGIKQAAEMPLDMEGARHRLDTDWRKWLERYPQQDSKKWDAEVTEFLAHVSNLSNIQDAPVPEKFQGMAFYYFQPEEFKIFDTKNITIVDDPQCTTGKAARFNGNGSHYYQLPFEMGCYDTVLAKTVKNYTSKEVPKGSGYTWLNLGKVKLSGNSDLYFTRAWTIQKTLSYFPLRNHTYDIWAEMKFTGPMYHADETGDENFIYLGMIVLVEVQDEK